jgi:predicted ATPase
MNLPINRISIENFKSFKKNETFELTPLTLLIGQNNSGKSSVIQAINILTESFLKDGRNIIDLNTFLNTKIDVGDLGGRYGSLNKFISRNSDSNIIKIEFDVFDQELLRNLKISIQIKVQTNQSVIHSIEVKESNKAIYEFINTFGYNSNDDFFLNSDYRYKINQLNLKHIFEDNYIKFEALVDWLIDYQLDAEILISKELNKLISEFSNIILNKISNEQNLIEYANTYVDILKSFYNIDNENINSGFNKLYKIISNSYKIDLYSKDINEDDKLFVGYIVNVFFQFYKNRKDLDNIDFSYEICRLFENLFFENYLNTGKEISYEEKRKKNEYQFEIKYNVAKGFETIYEDGIEMINKDVIKSWGEFVNDTFENLNNELTELFFNNIPIPFKNIDIFKNNDNDELLVDKDDIFEFDVFNYFKNNLIHRNSIYAENESFLLKILSTFERGKTNLFDLKSMIDDENEIFSDTVKNIIEYNLDISNPDWESPVFIQNIEDLILIKISKEEKIVSNSNSIINLYSLIPTKFAIQEDSLKAIKVFDFIIQNVLIDSITDDFSSHSALYFEENNFLFNKFFSSISILIFLKENNLTSLIRHSTTNEDIDLFNRNSRFYSLLDTRHSDKDDLFYLNILENINIQHILSKFKRGENEKFYDPYSIFLNTINRSFSNIHNLIRDKFIKQTHILPAIKSSLKRHVSLDDNRDPFAKIMNLSTNYQSFGYENPYLKLIGRTSKLLITRDVEYNIAKLEYINQEDQIINYVDEGHGIAHITMLCHSLFVLGQKENNYTIMVEEPEIGLHPSLQSKLADIFCLAIKNGVQLVIETHSEYLVRKLQYLTAKNNITTGDVSIYYFNLPEESEIKSAERCYNIKIKEDGTLTRNFGNGFYDEANNISLELFFERFSKSN